jgi:hypothetical protein
MTYLRSRVEHLGLSLRDIDKMPSCPVPGLSPEELRSRPGCEALVAMGTLPALRDWKGRADRVMALDGS